jgi:hypothetical protein
MQSLRVFKLAQSTVIDNTTDIRVVLMIDISWNVIQQMCSGKYFLEISGKHPLSLLECISYKGGHPSTERAQEGLQDERVCYQHWTCVKIFLVLLHNLLLNLPCNRAENITRQESDANFGSPVDRQISKPFVTSTLHLQHPSTSCNQFSNMPISSTLKSYLDVAKLPTQVQPAPFFRTPAMTDHLPILVPKPGYDPIPQYCFIAPPISCCASQRQEHQERPRTCLPYFRIRQSSIAVNVVVCARSHCSSGRCEIPRFQSSQDMLGAGLPVTGETYEYTGESSTR